MKATGLAARILYAAIALPAGFAAGFCATVWLLPAVAPALEIASPPAHTEELFRLGLSVGAVVAVPAFLCALTLPWRRRRHRGGRKWRWAASAVIVVAASLVFADLGHRLRYDLLFAAWLSYMLTMTFVRYGLLDRKHVARFATEMDED